MKVSVLMVTYNHRDYLAEAVESALAQRTAFDFEIVIAEDCSTDGTQEIVRRFAARYPDKVRPLLREKNLGASRNFVDAYFACRGRYVAMLEGDDYWTCEEKLQRQVEFLERHPECVLCGHPIHCVRDRDPEPIATRPNHWPPAVAGLEELVRDNYVPTCSAVFRHRLIDRFPPWFFTAGNGDWVIHVLNARHGKIGFLPEVMAAYRMHDGSLWNSKDYETRMGLILRTRRNLRALLDPRCRRINAQGIAENHLQLADHFRREGRMGRARRCVAEALLADPQVLWRQWPSFRRVMRLLGPPRKRGAA